MANEVVRHLTKAAGYCCIFGYMKANAAMSPRKHSNELGVTKRCIQVWKKKIKEGKCQCEGQANCYLANRPVIRANA